MPNQTWRVIITIVRCIVSVVQATRYAYEALTNVQSLFDYVQVHPHRQVVETNPPSVSFLLVTMPYGTWMVISTTFRCLESIVQAALYTYEVYTNVQLLLSWIRDYRRSQDVETGENLNEVIVD